MQSLAYPSDLPTILDRHQSSAKEALEEWHKDGMAQAGKGLSMPAGFTIQGRLLPSERARFGEKSASTCNILRFVSLE